MIVKSLISNQLLHQFFAFGFKWFFGFIGCCQALDKSITYHELFEVWYGGDCSKELEIKLENILDVLRNE